MSVKVNGDNWVPWPSTLKIYSPTSLSPSTQVSKLLPPFIGWSKDVIHKNFFTEEV